MQQDKQPRRRARRSEDEKRRLLEAWTQSGLSARVFGNREGVQPSYLWRWKRAAAERVVSRAVEPRGSITFAPVHVANSQPAVTSERVQAEVVLGRELRVRVFEGADIVQLSQLIHALAVGAAC